MSGESGAVWGISQSLSMNLGGGRALQRNICLVWMNIALTRYRTMQITPESGFLDAVLWKAPDTAITLFFRIKQNLRDIFLDPDTASNKEKSSTKTKKEGQ